MTVQDAYTSHLVKTQENWAAAVESLTENGKKFFADFNAPKLNADPNVAIDQVFDYWEKTLGAQREAAHTFVDATTTASEKAREQAETLGASVKEHLESIQETVAKQTASI